ncbi:quercetin dioxygenase-like cupin family protein [Comamonas odontotermitis]|uniref:Quercetin dioxygenase-like cupin family protein n=1 Tax=Comamonas odontotermitis TaxID=379895 RepID=A0ABR6RIF6_9BURK|nr:hypothetical protein [Comamonas odontotermitis]MBB6578941.1 quercetin dioxygenase-like cupin family protein [Comamonas odontotermitis]
MTSSIATRKPDLAMRTKLMRLQEAMLADSTTQVETPVTHHFAHGTYAREMFIPAGVTVVGKIHKHHSLNVLLSGDVSVLTESGIRRVAPGEVVESFPGIKRAAYAHVDSRWLTIHGTHDTDLERIENEFIAQSYEEYDSFAKQQLAQEVQPCLGE